MRKYLVWAMLALFLLNVACFFDHSFGGSLSQVAFRLNGVVFALIGLGGLVVFFKIPASESVMALVGILTLGSITSFAAAYGSFQTTAVFANLIISFLLFASAKRRKDK